MPSVTEASSGYHLASAEPAATGSVEKFYLRELDSASSSFGNQQIFETDDAFYCVTDFKYPDGSISSIVYFSDKEHREWLPLCGRPDCMHDSENCNAVTEGSVNMKIWLYGRHIYYIVGALGSGIPSLWRMKLDGSEHEKLLTLSAPELDDLSQYTWNWYFHAGYVFVEFITFQSKDPEEERDVYRYVVDLGADATEQKPFGGVFHDRLYIWVGDGDTLYAMGAEPDTLNKVFKISIPSQTIEELCTLPETPSRCWQLENGRLIIAGGSDAPSIYSVDIESGEYETIFTAEPNTQIWRFMYKGYVFGSGVKIDGGILGTHICADSGNEVASIPYEAYDADIDIVAVLGDHVFGFDISDDFDRVFYAPPDMYLDIRDIGTDNLMWRKWEPEG